MRTQRPRIRYKVFGPFRIERSRGGVIKKMRSQWWWAKEANGIRPSAAKGVYVFAIRGKGSSKITPWYVGKTEQRGFAAECFSRSKLKHYNAALHNHGHKSAEALLFLLARMTRRGKFTESTKKRDIDFMENYLIGLSLQQNKMLRNIQKTQFLKRIVVPGMLNPRPGNPGESALKLRRTLMGNA